MVDHLQSMLGGQAKTEYDSFVTFVLIRPGRAFLKILRQFTGIIKIPTNIEKVYNVISVNNEEIIVVTKHYDSALKHLDVLNYKDSNEEN